MKRKFKYTVEWESEIGLTNYKQDFETIEEARIALALHNRSNAVLKVVTLKQD
jgi:hypothetical protein